MGKTVVSSSMIDRVAAEAGPESCTKFRWVSSGSWTACWVARSDLLARKARARRFWRAMVRRGAPTKTASSRRLLSAEITARRGRDPGEIYAELSREYGPSFYERIDAPANAEQRAALAKLSPQDITATELAGEKIQQVLTTAPGDGNPIGGIKVITENGWFAARPSGTEDVYKIYAESFRSPDHLQRIQEEAQAIVMTRSETCATAPARSRS